MEISKLEGIKREAQANGWAHFIRTPADEKALLRGDRFFFERFDDFRYYIDTKIKLTKGSQWAGKPMELLPWHETVAGSLFGWIKSDGLRRFRRGYIEIPKKNSKTTLFAGIGLYMADQDGDGEPSSEVYNCATAKDQAAILWNIAADMIEADKNLSETMEVIRSTKTILRSGSYSSWFKAWSSDVGSKDGPDAHAVLVDELHAWKGAAARDFWEKVRYAGIARDQPFCPLVITTAGDDRYSLCWDQRVAAKKILDGFSDDLSSFVAIWGIHDDPRMQKNAKEYDPDFWKTEECWKIANPAYGLILKKEDFEADVAEVENNPTAKAGFFRYRLGVWIDSDNPWLKAGVWEKNIGPGFVEKDLHEQLCYTGIDMSSVHDFTAVGHVFPFITQEMVKEMTTNEEGKEVETGREILAYVKKFKVLARIYCPEDTFAERVRKDDTGSLKGWYDQGFIRLTPGDSIDHQTIFNDIKKDSEIFQIKQIAYDRNSAAWIVQEIAKKIPHIELFPVAQSMQGMSPPTKSFTVALSKSRIEHNGNPVLGWCASNAVTEVQNAQDNMMLHKGKSKEKIDPIVALIIGYNQAELGTMDMVKKFSPYSNEGFKVIKEIMGVKEAPADKVVEDANLKAEIMRRQIAVMEKKT